MLNEGDSLGNKLNWSPMHFFHAAHDLQFVRFVLAIAAEFAPLRA
jgi:hypothetical protein